MKKILLLIILSVSLTGCFFLTPHYYSYGQCIENKEDGLYYEEDGKPCKYINREIEREEKMKEKENINK